ncbi:metallophosphoesterase [candidate division KSB1 bacterium]|nr:metallophosphoesterase [candidate division KSB1 bacterium]
MNEAENKILNTNDFKNRIPARHFKARLNTQQGRVIKILGHELFRIRFGIAKIISFFTRIFFKSVGLYPLGYRNFLNIQLKENTFYLKNLPEQFENLKILQLSDLHLDKYPEIQDRLIEQIKNLSYDLCVLTGDYRWRKYGPNESAIQGLTRIRPYLKAPLGIYAILGNHDVIELVPHIENLGIQVLINESVVINRNGSTLGLAGVDDPHTYKLHDLNAAFAGISTQKFKILLAHSPEVYQAASVLGFDLYLTGHTHGGQICLPGGISLFNNSSCSRKYAQGGWHYGKMLGYTSSGVGASGAPLRYFCPPEITIHHLHSLTNPK